VQDLSGEERPAMFGESERERKTRHVTHDTHRKINRESFFRTFEKTDEDFKGL
jgi:hypothetical protein